MRPGSLRTALAGVGLIFVAGSSMGCADCNNAPASQRGLVCGTAIMATGKDEDRAAGMEREAAAAEKRREELEKRVATAQREVKLTSAQVQAATQRLDRIRAEVQQLRDRLAERRASATSPAAAAEATRIQNEIDAIDRERRSAAASVNTMDPATLQRLEGRTRDVNRALDRLATI